MKSVGNSSDILTRIGEQFGDSIAGLVRTLRAYAVTVASIDETENVAMVTLYDDRATFPVPLMLQNIAGGMFTVKPAIDSTAVISFMNGDENTPFFVAVSEVDEFMFVVGESKIRVIDGLIEMNGGTLNGLVAIDNLTKRLNKLQSELANIVSTFNSHTHPYTWSDGAGAGTTSASTSRATNPSTFQNNEYENTKIKQ